MDLAAAERLARELMDQHGLAGWRFRFDRAARRFGSCRYRQKLITLSARLTLLNAADQVRDTVLHEIAHALTPGDGHAASWRAVCARIGAKPARCYRDDEVVSPPTKPARFQIGCRTCGWWHDRRRLTARALVCRKCRQPVVYKDLRSGRLFRLTIVGHRRLIIAV